MSHCSKEMRIEVGAFHSILKCWKVVCAHSHTRSHTHSHAPVILGKIPTSNVALKRQQKTDEVVDK